MNRDLIFMQPNDTFSINPTSGDITQDVSLDFDVLPREYTLEITAQVLYLTQYLNIQ